MQSSGISWVATASATIGSTPARNRFALRARSVTLDHRVDAVRRDLADFHLADRVFAPHYAVPVRRSVGRVVPLLAAVSGPALSQLLPGEPFDVLEFTSTHAWGRSPIDGAVGFVIRDALVAEFAASHVVIARSTGVRPSPSTDRPALAALAMGTRVAATPAGDDWIEVDGGYVAAGDLIALGDMGGDAVGHALRLNGLATAAGGRSGDGVDAAGLVFLALALAGEPPARFADLQAGSVGLALAEGDAPRRGDLWFFADHVAMLVDADTAIHADDTVRCEPVAALARFGAIVARRRPA